MDKNNEEKNIELTEAAISCKNFFSDIDEHFQLLEENEQYRKSIHTFEKGRKLYLEVEVEDSKMSNWLFKWLLGGDENDKNWLPFGCRLETIHFDYPNKEDLKRKLNEFVDSL